MVKLFKKKTVHNLKKNRVTDAIPAGFRITVLTGQI